jgi:hypothetical protein
MLLWLSGFSSQKGHRLAHDGLTIYLVVDSCYCKGKAKNLPCFRLLAWLSQVRLLAWNLPILLHMACAIQPRPQTSAKLLAGLACCVNNTYDS